MSTFFNSALVFPQVVLLTQAPHDRQSIISDDESAILQSRQKSFIIGNRVKSLSNFEHNTQLPISRHSIKVLVISNVIAYKRSVDGRIPFSSKMIKLMSSSAILCDKRGEIFQHLQPATLLPAVVTLSKDCYLKPSGKCHEKVATFKRK